MDLSIVIVNYNGSRFIVKCLASLIKYINGGPDFEIIVMDNGSTDDSKEIVLEYIKDLDKVESGLQRKNHPRTHGKELIQLVSLNKNLGFARASNLGAEKACGDCLLFLNPDSEFMEPGVEKVIDFLQDKKSDDEKAGAVGVKIINNDTSLQYSSRGFITLARQFYETFFLDKIFSGTRVFGSYFMTWWDHMSEKEVDWVSGAFMLIKKDVFKNLGMFDEDFFMYSEDADLCLRLVRKGYKNYYFPFFRIIHHDAGIASVNQPLRDLQIWYSRRKYFHKHYSILHAGVFSFLYFLFILKRMVIFYIFSCFGMINSNYKIRALNYFKTLKMYFGSSKVSEN